MTGVLAPLCLAWVPLLEPIEITPWRLWLLLPLALAISVVYKAIKTRDHAAVPRQSGVLFAQIVAFMLLAMLGLWLLSELA